MLFRTKLYKYHTKSRHLMNYKTIITDENLHEQVQYPAKKLPISFYEDHFDDYLNGEANCHWHNDFEFGIVLRGQVGCYVSHGTSRPECCILKEGDGIFINSRFLHRVRQFTPGTVFFNFLVPIDFFKKFCYPEIHQKNILPVIQSNTSFLFFDSLSGNDSLFLKSMKEFQYLHFDDTDYELHCIELLCNMWRHIMVKTSTSNQNNDSSSKDNTIQEERLRLMLLYIHEYYKQDISVSDIANAANISKTECFRCFHAIANCSPSLYLQQYRLSKAIHLLNKTTLSLSEICYSCGFKSNSYFGKLFKEKLGISPGKYRKK